MRKKQNIYVALLGIGIISGIIIYALWRWKTPKPPEGFVIPNSCEIIGNINTHEAIELGLNWLKNSSKDSASLKPPMYIQWLKTEIKEMGLDVLSPWWFYVSLKNNFSGLAFKIGSKNTLDSFLRNKFPNQQTYNDTAIYLDTGISFFQKGSFLYLVFGARPSKKLFQSPALMPQRLMSYLNQRYSGQLIKLGIIKAAIPQYLNYLVKDSFVTAEVKINGSKLEALFKGITPAHLNIDTSIAAHFQMPLDKKFMSILNPSILMKQHIDTSEWWLSNVQLGIKIDGTVLHKTPFKSYQFDEEFNKVEKLSYQYKYIPGFQMNWETQQIISDKWVKKSIWDSLKMAKGRHFFSKNLFSFPTTITLNKNGWKCYTKEIVPPSNSQKGWLWMHLPKLKSIWNNAIGPLPSKFQFPEIYSIGFFEHSDYHHLIIQLNNDENAFIQILDIFKKLRNAR